MLNFYVRKQLLLSAHLSHCNCVSLSVRPCVTWVDQSKMVQAKITKSLQLAAWKILVSGTIKLFHKFERSHLKQRHQMRGGGKNLQFLANKSPYLNNGAR